MASVAHWVPHVAMLGGQTQFPTAHVASFEHENMHPPQCFGSVEGSTHAPVQEICGELHAPPLDVEPLEDPEAPPKLAPPCPSAGTSALSKLSPQPAASPTRIARPAATQTRLGEVGARSEGMPRP